MTRLSDEDMENLRNRLDWASRRGLRQAFEQIQAEAIERGKERDAEASRADSWALRFAAQFTPEKIARLDALEKAEAKVARLREALQALYDE